MRIIRRCIRNASLVTQTIFGLCFAFIIVWSGIGGFIGNDIMNSKVHADKEIDTNFDKVSDDLNMILSIGYGSWKDLYVQERLDVLQSVANVERYRLGIPNELNAGAANLNHGTKGYYSDRTHEIILSLDSLLYDSSWELLDTTCHEALSLL